ncbi:MAG: DUF4856 domain-containing protein [Halobacteriovoraceae bacterium]|nr:DUF4856 domain-containing protein [Halobacteriovoraceae bacterium]
MKISLALLALGIAPHAVADVYTDALSTLSQAPAEIQKVMKEAPSNYVYFSQFNRGTSVSYTGQTFRQILIEDIKGAMTSQPAGSYVGTKDEAINMLMSYYNYDEFTNLMAPGVIDGFSEFKVSAKSLAGQKMPITEGFFYSDVQSPGKNLKDKMAGNDNPLRRGKLYGVKGYNTPEDFVNGLFNLFADRATAGKAFTVPNGNLAPQTITEGYITEDGWDLAQLTQKFFHGAVSYSQAARDYFSTDLGPSKGLNADNTQPAKQGASYTAMEHHFDEGFGYFGGSRDFLSYSDLQSRTKVSMDTNGDGFISLKSEKNMGIATNVSRMDLTAADQDLDLSKELMEALLKGRELIAKKPSGYKKYVVANAQVALTNWEKTLAAVTIHYINVTLKQYQAYGTQNYLYTNFVKFWGEMKGFALSFQFSPRSLMDDSTFDRVHALMQTKPVLPHGPKAKVDQYVNNLLGARDLIAKTYGFSQNNTVNW